MAKSARSSTVKANNQRLKRGVFGPVEAARQERLSAKLLEIASQPKPVQEQKMEDVAEKGVYHMLRYRARIDSDDWYSGNREIKDRWRREDTRQ